MKTGKRANVFLFAIIATLCLCASMIFGGGDLFAEAEDGAPAPEPSTSVTVGIDVSASKMNPVGLGNLHVTGENAEQDKASKYRYETNGIFGGWQGVNLVFTEPLNAQKYTTAILPALLIYGGSNSWTVRMTKTDTDPSAAYVDERRISSSFPGEGIETRYTRLIIDLKKYADGDNLVRGINLGFSQTNDNNNAAWLLLNDITCYADTDSIAYVDVLASGMTNAEEGPGTSNKWDSLFDAKSFDTVATSQTVRFIEPITVDAAHKYAVFNAMFWGDASWVNASVTANGNSVASESVYILNSYDNYMLARNAKVVLPLEKLKNGENKIESITITHGAVSFSGYFMISDFELVAQNPSAVPQAGEIDYKRSGIMPATATENWNTEFTYEKQGVGTGNVELYFYEPIDTERYYAATLELLVWNPVNTTCHMSKADGAEVDTFAVCGHEKKNVLHDHSTVALRLSDYADNGKVSSVKLRIDAGAHLVFKDFVCFEIPESPAGKISGPLSALNAVHTIATWKEYFDFETKQDTASKTFTVEFIEPIEITHKYAVFNAMFWGGATWKNVTVTANGNSSASENVWIVQGYEDGYGSEKVLLPLEKFKTGDNMLRSITLSCDSLGSDSYQGFLLISELSFTDTPPAELVTGPGDIDYRASGLSKAAHNNEKWDEYFDYQKMGALGQEITLTFCEPIDTTTHKYAEFDMLLWGLTNWYDVTVKNGTKSATVLVPAYESVGVVDTLVGLPLEQLADENGKIESLTFVMPSDCGTFVDKDGVTQKRQLHFLVSDFTLKAEVPAGAIPEAGDIDYKRSGLIKTSATSPVAFWKDLFDYQAQVVDEAGNFINEGKLKIKFAVPIDANQTEYAVFNALLWGVPGFIDVPVTTPYGSETLSVYSYWAQTATEINTGNMLARLNLKNLADSNGKISELTFDFTNVSTDGNEFSGWFLFANFNYVNMQVGTAQNKNDISELMPIDESKSFTAAISGEEGEWAKHAFARAAAYDALEFEFAATYTEHFKFGMLVRTLRPADTVSKSGKFDGVLIEFTETYAKISAWNGDELVSSRYDGNLFASGESVKIKLEILETMLMGTPCGYTLRLTADETLLDDVYMDTQDITFGYYTHVLTANAGEVFTVSVSSASENPVSAAELMNVKLSATATDGATKRVPLKFTYADIGNIEVSAPIVNGAAHWDAVGKYLVFDGEGEVTVKYTVTNEFGTFESNTLTLNYTAPADTTKVPQEEGCGGVIGFEYDLAAVVLLGACAAVMALRKKKA